MCLKYVPHNYFSTSLRQFFFFFLSKGREDNTTLAILQQLPANGDFLNAAAALGTLPARWLELYISSWEDVFFLSP